MASKSNKSQLNKNNTNPVKNVTMTFLPILLYIAIYFLVSAIDALFVFLAQANSSAPVEHGVSATTLFNRAYNQPTNLANITLFTFILCGIITGLIYYKQIYLEDNEPVSPIPYLKDKLPIKLIITLVAAGILGQIITSALLALARPYFEKLFAEYDKLTASVNGASSCVAMIISVIIFAPIAEELMFRGLMLSFGKKLMPTILALFLQAIIFALYHGNPIQECYALIFGLILGLIALKTNSIIPGILFHACVNASLYIIPGFLFAGTASTIATLVVATLVLAALLILPGKLKHKTTNETT